MDAELPCPLRNGRRAFEVQVIVFHDSPVGFMVLALDACEMFLYLLRRKHVPHWSGNDGVPLFSTRINPFQRPLCRVCKTCWTENSCSSYIEHVHPKSRAARTQCQ